MSTFPSFISITIYSSSISIFSPFLYLYRKIYIVFLIPLDISLPSVFYLIRCLSLSLSLPHRLGTLVRARFWGRQHWGQASIGVWGINFYAMLLISLCCNPHPPSSIVLLFLIILSLLCLISSFFSNFPLCCNSYLHLPLTPVPQFCPFSALSCPFLSLYLPSLAYSSTFSLISVLWPDPSLTLTLILIFLVFSRPSLISHSDYQSYLRTLSCSYSLALLHSFFVLQFFLLLLWLSLSLFLVLLLLHLSFIAECLCMLARTNCMSLFFFCFTGTMSHL